MAFFLDPVSGLSALQRELERAFQNPLDLDLGVSGRGVFPAINIFSDRDGYVVRLAREPSPDRDQGRTAGRPAWPEYDTYR